MSKNVPTLLEVFAEKKTPKGFFTKLDKKLSGDPKVKNPAALAASIKNKKNEGEGPVDEASGMLKPEQEKLVKRAIKDLDGIVHVTHDDVPDLEEFLRNLLRASEAAEGEDPGEIEA